MPKLSQFIGTMTVLYWNDDCLAYSKIVAGDVQITQDELKELASREDPMVIEPNGTIMFIDRVQCFWKYADSYAGDAATLRWTLVL